MLVLIGEFSLLSSSPIFSPLFSLLFYFLLFTPVQKGHTKPLNLWFAMWC